MAAAADQPRLTASADPGGCWPRQYRPFTVVDGDERGARNGGGICRYGAEGLARSRRRAAQAIAPARGSSRAAAQTTLTAVSTVPDAVVTSNHASQTSSTAVTTNAVGTRCGRSAKTHAVAIRLISSMTSNPTQATFQWSARYRAGRRIASAMIHPTKPPPASRSARTSRHGYRARDAGAGAVSGSNARRCTWFCGSAVLNATSCSLIAMIVEPSFALSDRLAPSAAHSSPSAVVLEAD